jgi:RHS repeat-associated protein
MKADGNITSATRNLPLMPNLTNSTETFSYNGASQVSSYPYDMMGRLSGDDTRNYSWDLASRLISYTESDRNVAFTYDGLGMRVSRTSGGVTQQYVWNYAFGLTSISVVRQGGSDLRYYIHLPGGRLLHSIEAADNARRFYHFDEMGTTLFLSNDSGAITDSYGITPYGLVTASNGITENPFTFIGAYGVMEEGNTGLYYIRARYYDSVSGRFISPDPVRSIHPKQINPYQYGIANPLRYADPSGLQGGLNEIPPDELPDSLNFCSDGSSKRETPNKKNPIITLEELKEEAVAIRLKYGWSMMNPFTSLHFDSKYFWEYQGDPNELFYVQPLGRWMNKGEVNYYYQGLFWSDWGVPKWFMKRVIIIPWKFYYYGQLPDSRTMAAANLGYDQSEKEKVDEFLKQESERQRLAGILSILDPESRDINAHTLKYGNAVFDPQDDSGIANLYPR